MLVSRLAASRFFPLVKIGGGSKPPPYIAGIVSGTFYKMGLEISDSRAIIGAIII